MFGVWDRQNGMGATPKGTVRAKIETLALSRTPAAKPHPTLLLNIVRDLPSLLGGTSSPRGSPTKLFLQKPFKRDGKSIYSASPMSSLQTSRRGSARQAACAGASPAAGDLARFQLLKAQSLFCFKIAAVRRVNKLPRYYEACVETLGLFCRYVGMFVT